MKFAEGHDDEEHDAKPRNKDKDKDKKQKPEKDLKKRGLESFKSLILKNRWSTISRKGDETLHLEEKMNT